MKLKLKTLGAVVEVLGVRDGNTKCLVHEVGDAPYLVVGQVWWIPTVYFEFVEKEVV